MSELIAYVVKQGDYLTKIAHRYGFRARDVWDDPKNAELKAERKSMDILCPGDVLWIPKIPTEPRDVDVGATNPFTVHIPRTHVRHVFVIDDKPLANAKYWLHGLGKVVEGTTDGSGAVTFDAPVTVDSVRIVFENGPCFGLHLGHTDPSNTTSGALQRLEGLGYIWNFGEDNASDRLARLPAAIANFQAKFGIKPTGELDDETIAKLEVEYGS